MDQGNMGMMGHGMAEMGMHHTGMCGCGGGMGMGMDKNSWRKFMGKDEKIAKLEEYLKQLQMEEKGVMEKIAEMKSMK